MTNQKIALPSSNKLKKIRIDQLRFKPQESEELKKEVILFLEKFFQRFNSTPELAKNNQLATKVTKEVFAKLTSWRFCKQRPADPEKFQEIISSFIKKEQPISLIIGHGPSKNLNNCDYSRVDWSEFFCLSQLDFLNQKVKEIYPPGLKISFFLDDLRTELSNGLAPENTISYFKSFQELKEQLDLNHFIEQIVSIKDLYRDFKTESFLAQAENLVKQWESNPENQPQISAQIENAARNIPNLDQLSSKEQIEFLGIATHKYRVYYQAEKLSGIWSIPENLYARFYKHENFWQLFTIRKGSITQPWQGQGCLLLNSLNKLEPLVLTKEKQKQVETIAEVKIKANDLPVNQGLTNLIDFQQIRVVRPL